MAKASVHYDWLRLIEVSGPFLSATVLDGAFPTGLDGLDKTVKRHLSHYYDEWLEAVETKSPLLAELHKAWCEAVLHEGLEFHENDLQSGGDYTIKGEGGLGEFSADEILKDEDGTPIFFIKILSADIKPHDRDTADDWKDTYIEKMTRLCRAHEVRVGLITNGEQWVLVNAAPGGSLSGCATWHARLWFQEDGTLRAFIALLGSRRFFGAPAKRLPRLLDESLQHLEEVTDTLGKQVMAAVEVLLEGFDRADLDAGRTLLADVDPKELYEASLTVMMRLIFLLCAEERGLLLLGEKNYDDVYAVSTLRNKLEKESDRFGPQVLERRFDAWTRLLSVFRAVFAGIDHPGLHLPAMGGSLFDPDRYPFLEGRSKGDKWWSCNPQPLPIDNRTVLHLLESLQVLNHRNGAIQLSFRSLDVEQIGYIYEGLLEFTAKKAPEILLGLKGDKSHLNPEIALSELESLALDSEEKLIARVKDLTGRSALAREYSLPPDLDLMPQLVKVCRGDNALIARVQPYLNWLRLSAWGEPVVYHKDSFYVTEGVDRRSSGTHYTPKALTEMIVREALEPVVYDGPSKGTPRAEWRLKSPSELLELKVCDPAMGSGAFLVQACRYLGDRLVDSWEAEEKSGSAIESDGSVTKFPPKDPMSGLADDRLCAARRLVAEKCLYGVDINPLAVELAKLSLWLVTISKGRPFGFLDHNLKSGDSLLGVSDIKQLIQFRMKPSSSASGNLMTNRIEEALKQATEEREAIRNGRSRDIQDVALQQQHYRKAEELMWHIKEYADYFIGEVLVAGKPSKKTDSKLDAAAIDGADLITGDSLRYVMLRKKTLANLAYDLPVGQTAPRRPFHWAIEFPEVFSQGGFNAIVGNPPFMGGRHIRGSFGDVYRVHLVNYIACAIQGAADFVAYFYIRAFNLLTKNGVFGLIACNTIAEGDTRQVGLENILKRGGVIVSAHPNMSWPGAASVVISPVTLYRPGVPWNGKILLDNCTATCISPFLTEGESWTPKRLASNECQAYQGTLVLGSSFVLSLDECDRLLHIDPRSEDVLWPFMNGDDLNTSPTQKYSRYVINFFDWPLKRADEEAWRNASDAEKRDLRKVGIVRFDYEGRVASDYAVALQFLEEKLKTNNPNAFSDPKRPLWWQFWRPRSELYHLIGRGGDYATHPQTWDRSLWIDNVIVAPLTTKHLQPILVKNQSIYSHAIGVFTKNSYGLLGLLNSSIFIAWTRKNCSSLGQGFRFTPADGYETYPFPINVNVSANIAQNYEENRKSIMTARQIGLTALYNLFHNPAETDAEIEEMRRLQREIDTAVRDSYGWQDIDLGHGFHEVGYLPANDNIRYTISESARIEILKRLSALNRQRWEEEEKAGLHKKKGKK